MIQPPVLFSHINPGVQSWFDDLLDSISALFTSFPVPLAVLLGVIVSIIIVRMVVNLL